MPACACWQRSSAAAACGPKWCPPHARDAFLARGRSSLYSAMTTETAMPKSLTRTTRRRLLRTTMLGAAAAASAAMPAVLRAQSAGVKIGVLHPVSGSLSLNGQQGRLGATLAVDEINAGGGIKALNGARIEPVLGDAQSTPEGGNAEVEKMNSAGVACIVGGYGSSICLAASQTAPPYHLPYVVDGGVVDAIVTRGVENTF